MINLKTLVSSINTETQPWSLLEVTIFVSIWFSSILRGIDLNGVEILHVQQKTLNRSNNDAFEHTRNG